LWWSFIDVEWLDSAREAMKNKGSQGNCNVLAAGSLCKPSLDLGLTAAVEPRLLFLPTCKENNVEPDGQITIT
jgi:hypothetical protein